MSDLKARRLDEIKDWRSAFRSFNIVSDNVEPAMRQRDEMVEIIDDLLSFMDTPEVSVNNRVIFQVGYNSYLLAEHVRVIDIAMLVRALDGALELGWDDTLKDDKEAPNVQIRVVPREAIKAPVPVIDDAATHIPTEEIDQLTKHKFVPLDGDPEFCGVDGCHNMMSDEVHDVTEPIKPEDEVSPGGIDSATANE